MIIIISIGVTGLTFIIIYNFIYYLKIKIYKIYKICIT